jgi:hypothetical protein
MQVSWPSLFLTIIRQASRQVHLFSRITTFCSVLTFAQIAHVQAQIIINKIVLALEITIIPHAMGFRRKFKMEFLS